jgi:hypothetical protein
MANEVQTVVVLQDESGQYYCLTPAMLEQARVPAEQVPAIEEALGGDVSGFAAYLTPSLYSASPRLASPFEGRLLNPQPLPPRFGALSQAGIIVVGG